MTPPLITPVILCGGSGTRLWPLSRRSFPKQFSPFVGEKSLFQATVERFSGEGFTRPLILTGEDFRFIAVEQLAAIEQDPLKILVEPSQRNTGPAILAAAQWLAHQGAADTLMLVAPADHIIPDTEKLQNAITAALAEAQQGHLISLGVVPTRPATGYGYFEIADQPELHKPAAVQSFVEKPSEQRARGLMEAGRSLWNTGIFLAQAATMLEIYQDCDPDTVQRLQRALESREEDMSFVRLPQSEWDKVRDISIDYAVLEHAKHHMVIPFSGRWSDLGDWAAVQEHANPDKNGVSTRGAALALDCHDTLLYAGDKHQQLVGIGLQDIIAVALPDAVLVGHKNRTQEVREAVEQLKAHKVAQATQFPADYRPWGWFESLVVGTRFQVKRIFVHPGAALSLQSHHHRSEHWVVVEGTAKITIGEQVQLVGENQSVYIPLGVQHRMENPGKIPMVLIEIQTGSYLGEDDIVRYEDIYARK